MCSIKHTKRNKMISVDRNDFLKGAYETGSFNLRMQDNQFKTLVTKYLLHRYYIFNAMYNWSHLIIYLLSRLLFSHGNLV